MKTLACTAALACATLALPLHAQTAGPVPAAELPMRLTGDLGVGVFSTESIIRGKDTRTPVLPYGYLDYGRFFWRVDTAGFKTMRLGYGYLEVLGKVTLEGYKPNSGATPGVTAERKDAVPLGIGTFQETPWGGVFLNAYHDFGKSGGNLLEAIYAAKLQAGSWSIYPQLGVERRTGNYVRYFYGVSGTESAAGGLAAYAPGAATSTFVGLAASWPVSQNWSLNLQARHKWLGSEIRNSPLVDQRTQTSGYVALAYTFK